MTIDPFDALEQQLRARVAESRRKRRSRWRAHPFLAVLLAAGVTASGVAVAAGGLRGGPDDEERGERIAYAVMQEAERDPACKSPQFVKDSPITLLDAAPPEAVVAAMPFMREPAPEAELQRGISVLNASHPVGGTVVIRSTIRIIELDDRWSVLTRVERGQGGFGVHDPAACVTLRDKLLTERAGSGGLRAFMAARQVLDRDTRVNPEAMTLWFVLLSRGRPTAGTGQPILPGSGSGFGHVVRRGVVMNASGSRSRGREYLGLADPATVRMRVWSTRADVRTRIPKAVTVHRGFWRLALPPHTGPVRLTEIGPDGEKGRVVRLRG